MLSLSRVDGTIQRASIEVGPVCLMEMSGDAGASGCVCVCV